jgi:hypothetical protein
LICSALVAQAVPAAEEEDGAATAGVSLLLAEAAGALGLAAGVEPDAAGALLLPDEAQPARAAAAISAPAVRASLPDPDIPFP